LLDSCRSLCPFLCSCPVLVNVNVTVLIFCPFSIFVSQCSCLVLVLSFFVPCDVEVSVLVLVLAMSMFLSCSCPSTHSWILVLSQSLSLSLICQCSCHVLVHPLVLGFLFCLCPVQCVYFLVLFLFTHCWILVAVSVPVLYTGCERYCRPFFKMVSCINRLSDHDKIFTVYPLLHLLLSSGVHLPVRLKGPRQENQRAVIVKIIRAV
jgi:hypothetical protein